MSAVILGVHHAGVLLGRNSFREVARHRAALHVAGSRGLSHRVASDVGVLMRWARVGVSRTEPLGAHLVVLNTGGHAGLVGLLVK